MFIRSLGPALLITGCFLLFACGDTAPEPLAPEHTERALAKGGVPGPPDKDDGDGGDDGSDDEAIGADIVVGDFVGSGEILGSTCPGSYKSPHWDVDFGHSECLLVSLDWNLESSYDPYMLTDDIKLIITKENGREGRITHVKLIGQDVIGDAGIAHDTDAVAVAQPVTPSKSGFTLHVHAHDIPVWRKDSHTGGDRVEVIGWVDIGDIVYR